MIYNSARSLESLGRCDEATARYERCAAAAERAGVPPGHVFCVLGLASVLVGKGNAVEARTAYRAAVENLSHTVDATHPKLLLAQQLEMVISKDQ